MREKQGINDTRNPNDEEIADCVCHERGADNELHALLDCQKDEDAEQHFYYLRERI